MNESKRQEKLVTRQNAETEELSFVDGELLEIPIDEKLTAKKYTEISTEIETPKTKNENQNQKSYLQYVFLPLIFLTVALVGGLRISATDDAFVFLKPPLMCLIFATILLVLFFRANLIKLDGWFSENFSGLKNVANAMILVSLFAASTQVFNALLPEQGLPFWTFAFCFFWTLWNNLFAKFDTKRLLQSLGGLFGLAFVVKYLILAGLTAPANNNWIQGIFENPAQEAFTWLLDLPKFAPATGYIQFFTLVFYLIGLFLLKPETRKIDNVGAGLVPAR
ncbi:hypothetical protein BH24ACI1_BH24ACI1_08460 [soil metagenome]|jgi:hypothetical protein|nr:hypothetical protein [Pyrinomonadaceae bacterium]